MDTRETYAVGAHIRMMRPTLTPLETRIIDSVINHPFDKDTSLRQVSQTAEVSEAMVVKTAKKLGFEGFRDFRRRISDYNRLPTAALHQEISSDDSAREVLSKVFNTAIQALQETLAIIDVPTFERVVEAIHRARQRDLYGVGGSAQIARDVAHKFLRIGLRSAIYDDSHMMLMSASLLGENDIAIGFSHSGGTTAVIDAIRLARESGATTIAITNYAASPLTHVAQHVLCSTGRGSPLLGENAAARVAQLNIMDAVFAAVAQKDYDSAEQNLQRTTMAVVAKRER
jgi:RpiR family transcriptional regulator, repressor of rpiB and als operon